MSTTTPNVPQKGNKSVRFSSLIILLLILTILSLLAFGWFYFHRINPVNKVAPSLIKTSVPPVYAFSVTASSGAAMLNKPLAVASDGLGRIYVADTGNGLVKVYDPTGQYLSSFGKDQLKNPFQMTYAGGRIWVADPGIRKVQVFTTEGKLEKTFIQSPKDKDPTATEELIPVAVALDNSGNVYIADTANHVIRVYDKNAKETKKIGHPGNDKGGLAYPNALWIADKKIFVSDTNNARIQIFDLQGNVLQTIDAQKTTTGQLTMPRGLVVAPNGQILVVDVFMHMIRAFDQQGNELWTLGRQGLGNDGFNFPNGLWLDSSGKMYVADRENNRIQVFKF
jgi:DNA-binding beta-propeller fold protein YncE